jgi:nucleotide-binding universal stress UspA family protein
MLKQLARKNSSRSSEKPVTNYHRPFQHPDVRNYRQTGITRPRPISSFPAEAPYSILRKKRCFKIKLSTIPNGLFVALLGCKAGVRERRGTETGSRRSTRRNALQEAASIIQMTCFRKGEAMKTQEMTEIDDLAARAVPPTSGHPDTFLRHILWSTDFSAPSKISLPIAAALARRFGSRLYAAHVISPYSLCFGPGLALLRLGMAEQMAARKMSTTLDSHQLGDIPHENIVGLGKTSRVLANMAEDFDVDLLVLGTHGRKGLVGKVLGSVAEETIHISPCPVLTVGVPASRTGLNKVDLKHILCATDFSLESVSAVRLALQWARSFSASLTLLHVVEGSVAGAPDERGRLATFFEERLQRLMPRDARELPGLELRIEFGSAPESILEVAHQTGTGLLVLGTRRVEVLARRPTRRATAQILSNALCPVLTVNHAAVQL